MIAKSNLHIFILRFMGCDVFVDVCPRVKAL